MVSIAPPDAQAREVARRHLDVLAKPLGALGRLEDLAVWLAGVQRTGTPNPPASVAVVLFAGDHGVTKDHQTVSAYPRNVTTFMVREFLRGGAAVNVLANAHHAGVEVFDIAVDDDLEGVPEQVLRHKVRRGSGSIDREDALSRVETEEALAAGALIADEQIVAGADLLIPGDMGIGNSTVAATLVGAALELTAVDVVGRGTGIDDAARDEKLAVVSAALERARLHHDNPAALLRAVGSADMAAMTGLLVRAANQGVPVMLDGVVSGACALLAERLAPGAAAWWCAGHRSTEPAHRRSLEALELEPIVDLGMRLGEATGALIALPVLRSAPTLLSQMSTLAEIVGNQPDPDS